MKCREVKAGHFCLQLLLITVLDSFLVLFGISYLDALDMSVKASTLYSSRVCTIPSVNLANVHSPITLCFSLYLTYTRTHKLFFSPLSPFSSLDSECSPSLSVQVNSSWFSGSNALSVFSVYVGLDVDQDGEPLHAFHPNR